MPMASSDCEEEVRRWGFSTVFTWTDLPYVITITAQQSEKRGPHSHKGLTTHLIVDGQLTISFPQDENPTKTIYSVGDRIDVDALRIHEVWIGARGCTMVIGE
ncbi:hypothetical protein GGS21DRAFT_488356 [Xylaria nigripes]|nr:hypothetical protein GGS21DRAFT_488356 [Xylaria nigripes]